MLVAGLGQMLGQIPRPENTEYPGQPGEKVAAVELRLDKKREAALWAVHRLRDLVAADGRGPMFSGEEILAILNGDAADHETMTTDEIDHRAMYAPPYDAIESRHTFPTMLAHSRCTKCDRQRSDVYVMTQGRVCPGERTGRPVMDRPQA